jgi:apolipoprotein N-acyltransferase
VSGARTRALVAAAASGALLAAARPPLDLGPLALVALVPLFVAWRGAPARRRALLAFVAGLAYHAVLVSWSWYFGAVAIVPLTVALAAYWAAAGAVTGWLAGRGVQSPWLTAAVWVVAEAAVARAPFGGLSWGEVGYALHDVALARQLASLGGVALVSFAAVAVNALVADLVARAARPTRLGAAAGLAAVAVVAPLAAALAPGTRPAGELRVAILQGNDKNRDLTAAELRSRYLPESHFALVDDVRGDADLIIFPESSMDEDPRTDPELGDRLARVARERDAWVLANATADAPQDPDDHVYNLNVLYDPSGRVAGTYAKRHLVPFGERVPFGSVLRPIVPALDREIPRDFLPGDEPGRFRVGEVDIATVICFESAFGHEVRPLVRDGAEVVVVSTNNRSYRRSANSAQHVAIGQMRAAETGRPVVHAAISGISAVIDADGDVVADTALFDRTVLERTVHAHRGRTMYVRIGEWVPWAAGSAVAAGAIAGLVRRRRRSVDSGVARPDRAPDPPPLVSPTTGDRA